FGLLLPRRPTPDTAPRHSGHSWASAHEPGLVSAMVRHMTTARVTSIVLVGLLLLTGCSGSSDSASGGDRAAVAYASDGAEAADDAGATAEREVITTGSLTLVADDAETAADDVVALVERAGGRAARD